MRCGCGRRRSQDQELCPKCAAVTTDRKILVSRVPVWRMGRKMWTYEYRVPGSLVPVNFGPGIERLRRTLSQWYPGYTIKETW